MREFAFVIVILLAFFFLSFPEISNALGELTQVQKDQLLLEHNQVRQWVVPTAANMMLLQWDVQLEAFAQNFTSSCNFAHSSVQLRTNTFGTFVGENVAAWAGTTRQPWQAVGLFYQDFQYYDIQNNTCSPLSASSCMNYLQLIAATTTRMGCATKFCPQLTGYQSSNAYVISCNYIAGFTAATRPYVAGVPCSKCPIGTSCSNTDGDVLCKATVPGTTPAKIVVTFALVNPTAVYYYSASQPIVLNITTPSPIPSGSSCSLAVQIASSSSVILFFASGQQYATFALSTAITTGPISLDFSIPTSYANGGLPIFFVPPDHLQLTIRGKVSILLGTLSPFLWAETESAPIQITLSGALPPNLFLTVSYDILQNSTAAGSTVFLSDGQTASSFKVTPPLFDNVTLSFALGGTAEPYFDIFPADVITILVCAKPTPLIVTVRQADANADLLKNLVAITAGNIPASDVQVAMYDQDNVNHLTQLSVQIWNRNWTQANAAVMNSVNDPNSPLRTTGKVQTVTVMNALPATTPSTTAAPSATENNSGEKAGTAITSFTVASIVYGIILSAANSIVMGGTTAMMGVLYGSSVFGLMDNLQFAAVTATVDPTSNIPYNNFGDYLNWTNFRVVPPPPAVTSSSTRQLRSANGTDNVHCSDDVFYALVETVCISVGMLLVCFLVRSLVAMAVRHIIINKRLKKDGIRADVLVQTPACLLFPRWEILLLLMEYMGFCQTAGLAIGSFGCNPYLIGGICLLILVPGIILVASVIHVRFRLRLNAEYVTLRKGAVLVEAAQKYAGGARESSLECSFRRLQIWRLQGQWSPKHLTFVRLMEPLMGAYTEECRFYFAFDFLRKISLGLALGVGQNSRARSCGILAVTIVEVALLGFLQPMRDRVRNRVAFACAVFRLCVCCFLFVIAFDINSPDYAGKMAFICILVAITLSLLQVLYDGIIAALALIYGNKYRIEKVVVETIIQEKQQQHQQLPPVQHIVPSRQPSFMTLATITAVEDEEEHIGNDDYSQQQKHQHQQHLQQSWDKEQIKMEHDGYTHNEHEEDFIFNRSVEEDDKTSRISSQVTVTPPRKPAAIVRQSSLLSVSQASLGSKRTTITPLENGNEQQDPQQQRVYVIPHPQQQQHQQLRLQKQPSFSSITEKLRTPLNMPRFSNSGIETGRVLPSLKITRRQQQQQQQPEEEDDDEDADEDDEEDEENEEENDCDDCNDCNEENEENEDDDDEEEEEDDEAEGDHGHPLNTIQGDNTDSEDDLG